MHTEPHNWEEKVAAAYENGCKRFDGAIKGFGGCPMAKDDLTGNMPMENMVYYFDTQQAQANINSQALAASMQKAEDVFPNH